jgi:hypothetical protein
MDVLPSRSCQRRHVQGVDRYCERLALPTALASLATNPEAGRACHGDNDTGGFYAFLDSAEEVVVVVLRLDGQQLQAGVLTLSYGPFTRWQLTDHAGLSGFDSLSAQFRRIVGSEAGKVASYLADSANTATLCP